MNVTVNEMAEFSKFPPALLILGYNCAYLCFILYTFLPAEEFM